MTTYGIVNGYYTASNYDLVTRILRGEWGFTGIVMTDWWAKGNDEKEEGTHQNMAAMIRAQNDLNMVTACAEENTTHDNSLEAACCGKSHQRRISEKRHEYLPLYLKNACICQNDRCWQ